MIVTLTGGLHLEPRHVSDVGPSIQSLHFIV